MDILIHKAAVAITNKLDADQKKSELDRLALQYGTESLLINLCSTAIILTVALILGTFKETLIMYFVFGSLRLSSGGMHSNTMFQCLGITGFIVVIIPKLTVYFTLSLPVIIAGYVVLFLLYAIYAPSGTIEHPVPEADRMPRKIQTLLLLSLFIIGSMFVGDMLRQLMLMGACAQSITILPFANKKYKKV